MGTDASHSSGVQGTKRRRNENQKSWKRKHRQRFGRASSNDVRRDLPPGSRGFLVTCDPKHENQCFREALVLLGEQVEVLCPHLAAAFTPPPLPRRAKDGPPNPAAELQQELAALRNGGAQEVPAVFARVDLSVQGSVFVRVDDVRIPVHDVVERVLRLARENGTPSSRNCVRFVPVHTTCYAKADLAGRAAGTVAEKEFPAGKCTFAIAFRSRMNSDAHREDYITAVAAGIEEAMPGRCQVNLDNPDVVLIVEVAKTTCVMGCFRPYYELAKLNIREVSKPRGEEPSGDNPSSQPKNQDQRDTTTPPRVVEKKESANETKNGPCQSAHDVTKPEGPGEKSPLANIEAPPSSEKPSTLPRAKKDGELQNEAVKGTTPAGAIDLLPSVTVVDVTAENGLGDEMPRKDSTGKTSSDLVTALSREEQLPSACPNGQGE